MWFNKEVFERFERFEQLSRRFNLMEIAVAEELQQQRNKVALIEKKVVEFGWIERRVKTLEKNVNDLMNENVDIISHIRKLEEKDKELTIVRDEERGGTVLKENELEPRVGDLVVSRKDERDIRKVCANGYGFLLVGRDFRTVYPKDSLVKDLMSEWKVIARREDLK